MVVSGQATINDTLLVDATNENFIIRSPLVDRFTVDTDNGNTFIAGTTQIEGLTTINDNLDLNGNADVSGTSTLGDVVTITCLLYTSPSPRDVEESRMPSSA